MKECFDLVPTAKWLICKLRSFFIGRKLKEKYWSYLNHLSRARWLCCECNPTNLISWIVKNSECSWQLRDHWTFSYHLHRKLEELGMDEMWKIIGRKYGWQWRPSKLSIWGGVHFHIRGWETIYHQRWESCLYFQYLLHFQQDQRSIWRFSNKTYQLSGLT